MDSHPKGRETNNKSEKKKHFISAALAASHQAVQQEKQANKKTSNEHMTTPFSLVKCVIETDTLLASIHFNIMRQLWLITLIAQHAVTKPLFVQIKVNKKV